MLRLAACGFKKIKCKYGMNAFWKNGNNTKFFTSMSSGLEQRRSDFQSDMSGWKPDLQAFGFAFGRR